MTEYEPFLTTEKIEELRNEALQARENAYAPYSSYQVGAAVLAGSGRIYTGCNVENASYGATICAERVAAASAIAAGEREFLALAVVSDSSIPGPPCGICLQFLAEFAPHLPIFCYNLLGKCEKGSLGAYLPTVFDQTYLKSTRGR